MTSDFDVVVRNPYLENTSEYAKAVILARATLADDAKNVMLRHVPSNRAALQWRPETGGSTVSTTPGGTGAGRASDGYIEADWLHLTRSGNRFEALGSTDGENWTLTPSTRLKPWDSSRWGSGISATPHGGNFLLRRP